MNHGYCEKCWWWQETQETQETQEKSLLRKNAKVGFCHFANLDYIYFDSYCPDYVNRIRENKAGTLQDFLKKTKT